MAFTHAQQEAYVKNPQHCPYCGSNEINAHGVDYENSTCNIDCDNCHKKWREFLIMKVVRIEEID